MRGIETSQWRELNAEQRREVLKRPSSSRSREVVDSVAAIIKTVREGGDRAILEYTRKFDNANLTTLAVSEDEIRASAVQITDAIRGALNEAIRRIREFHDAQMPRPIRVESSPGAVCERRYFPIERVGLYIPGGSAPLPSTLMMLTIPAQVAGCRELILVTPPNRAGEINPVILAAAERLGIQRIFKCGGAQAIAALAFGSESIPKVDKIFGPGNAWVTEAKLQVAFDPEGAAIDLPAGPSEVLVIADSSAAPEFVAADLLSQAEHDRDSQVILVSTSAATIEAVQSELRAQLADLPRRAIAEVALASSRAILAANIQEAVQIANLYAPEHLILQVENAREVATQIRHAGSVFIGPWTPESVGDYASGTNHVLPTYGFARAFSGLGVESFMKSISFQEFMPNALAEISTVVETLAAAEGLEAHRRAVHLRVQSLRTKGIQ